MQYMHKYIYMQQLLLFINNKRIHLINLREILFDKYLKKLVYF